MSNLVMGLLVLQVVGGVYLFSLTASTGQAASNARATRLPSLLVFGHSLLGLLAPALWLAWLLTHAQGWVWATLVSLLSSVAGGLVMLAKTVRGPAAVDRPAADPADVRVVEKQIPHAALVGHGGLAALIVVCVVAVGLTA